MSHLRYIYIFYILFCSAVIASEDVDFILNERPLPVQIGRSFYGVNISPHVPLPKDDVLKDLGIGKMRVGGNEYDAYNWKNSTVYNPEYGHVKMQSFREISMVLNRINIEGIFQVNLTGIKSLRKGGKWTFRSSFDPLDSSRFLSEYNSKKETFIKNFSLGNEFDLWGQTHSYYFLNKAISADEYINRYIKTAIELRLAQKKLNGKPYSIKLWGPEISSSYNGWQTENLKSDCKWKDNGKGYSCRYGKKKEFSYFIPYFLYRLKEAEKNLAINPNKFKLIDYLTFHYYPTFRTNLADPTSLIVGKDNRFPLSGALGATKVFYDSNYVNSLDKSSPFTKNINILKKFKEWANKYSIGLKIGLTEFGIDPDDLVFSYPRPLRSLYLASLIGISSQYGLNFLNKFRLNSVSPNIAPWSLLINNKKTDLYYMYRLFAKNYLGTIVNVKKLINNEILVYGVMKDEKLGIFVINQSNRKNELTIKVDLTGFKKTILSIKTVPYSIRYIRYDINLNNLFQDEIVIPTKKKLN